MRLCRDTRAWGPEWLQLCATEPALPIIAADAARGTSEFNPLEILSKHDINN